MAKGVLFREVSSIPGCPYRRSEQDAPLASPASINYLELSKHDNPKCSTRSSSGVSGVWVVLLYDHKETHKLAGNHSTHSALVPVVYQ